MPTKVRVTLDIVYDLTPNYLNKIEIEKLLALQCHIFEKEDSFTWKDVKILDYNFKINTSGPPKRNDKKFLKRKTKE